MPQPKSTSAAAVASLIFGILGCVPFITGLLAVILGIVGIRSTGNPRYSGRGLAVGGLILGLLSLVLWGLFGGTLYAWYVYSGPARQVSGQFAQDLAAGNIPAAQARCTSTVSAEELTRVSDHIKPWGALQSTTLIGVPGQSAGGETVAVGGQALFANKGAVAYTLHLVKQGSELKVDGFRLEHDGEVVGAGTEPMSRGPRTTGPRTTRPATTRSSG